MLGASDETALFPRHVRIGISKYGDLPSLGEFFFPLLLSLRGDLKLRMS